LHINLLPPIFPKYSPNIAIKGKSIQCLTDGADNIAKPGIRGYSYGIQGAIIIGTNDKAEKKAITWHTAFFDAIRLELYPYRDVLSFEFEHSLTSEPLGIDVVIVKKEPGAVIEKPIGAIFRAVNVVEYKSPGDYLSIEDFHKVGAYARLYSALNGTAITDMTITYVMRTGQKGRSSRKRAGKKSGKS
jgi:hypothetical protein